MIEPREVLWKEKNYRTIEKGTGWEIQRPAEIKPLEYLLDNFLRRKKKWE